MVWRTMEEWNDRGRFISRGEKCLLRDPDGNCLWNKDQTSKIKRKQYPEYVREDWVSGGDQDRNWDDRDSVICEEYS